MLHGDNLARRFKGNPKEEDWWRYHSAEGGDRYASVAQ
jgi:hypothetical protein